MTPSGPCSRPTPVPWSAAIERALYDPAGFYLAGDGAAGHFRTSAAASSSVREIFAEALAELLERVDVALGRPDPLDLVDVGAGSGDLLDAVLVALGSESAARVRPVVVERRPRPVALPAYMRWFDRVPETTGLLIANEWLDNVGIDVVVGDRVLVVDPAGAESWGPAVAADQAAWLARWWPCGDRREVGLRRDLAWAEAVSRVGRGLAVAIDYSHTAADRPAYGSLTGFRRGRETDPIPDGSCDLTAHVAIDSVAAAGASSGAAAGRVVRSLLIDQRTALRSLGVGGARPTYAAAPGGYPAALQRASEAAELIDPAGLGAFAWLLQGVDLDPASVLA